MNRIVKEHYPASKLPENLREGINPGRQVRITIEDEHVSPTPEQLKALIEKAHRHAREGTIDDAVSRVRALRDEWDD